MTTSAQIYPRSIVTINDGPMQFISWETNNNGYYQADTFAVKLPLFQSQVAWWSQQASLDVKIYDGLVKDPQNFSISNLTLRIQGQVDTIDLDPIQRTVRITGRDYTSKLIDTKVALSDRNITASDFAIKMAAIYGLDVGDSALMDTETGKIGDGPIIQTYTKIGTYYQIDHVNTKVERSAWDILCYLAHQEQFIVYVSGQTLNFKPLADPEKARVLTIDRSQGITTGPAPSLSFTRTLTLARGIVVYVRSWNHKIKAGFTVSARMKRSKDPVQKKNSPRTGEEQVYTYTIPNLTRDAAQQKANAYLAAISKHEVRFTADDMPGDPTLDPFQPVKWSYQGTMYEQVYYLESVIRSFDFESGYKMSLRGKNHSVESVVLA